MNKILMVLTQANELSLKGGGKHLTGAWAEEFALPYKRLKEEGYEIDIATIEGKPVTFDPLSLDPEFLKSLNMDPEIAVESSKTIKEAGEKLQSPLKLEDLVKDQNWEKIKQYKGIFIPGGHGVMEDLANSKAMGELLVEAHNNNIPTGAVCHGPCALLKAFDSNGNWIYKGYKITGFTNTEEDQDLGVLGGEPLFRQETELRKLGADFIPGKPWTSHVVRDCELITGQNPQSSKEIAEDFILRLKYSYSRMSGTSMSQSTIPYSSISLLIESSWPLVLNVRF